MNSARSLVVAMGLILLSGQVTFAQDMSRYRSYVLESSLDAVVAASGARAADATTVHVRPATIQELQWRAPYVGSRAGSADPVREIRFTFYNGALYQVIVNYDRHRTEGLTNDDVIESISAAYGVPLLASVGRPASPPPEAFADSIVLARWESAESVLTLVRGNYVRELQLILTSRALSPGARSAIREAIRLDALEAPRREAERREQAASDASAALDQARITNKDAFRP